MPVRTPQQTDLAKLVFSQLAQPTLHIRGQLEQPLLDLAEHLERVFIGTSANAGGIAFGLLDQARALGLDRRQQPLLFERLLHFGLRLAEQPVLLANHAARLLDLIRHRHAHAVDDIENSVFIDQQARAEGYTPPFGKHIFQFINQVVEFDGTHPLH